MSREIHGLHKLYGQRYLRIIFLSTLCPNSIAKDIFPKMGCCSNKLVFLERLSARQAFLTFIFSGRSVTDAGGSDLTHSPLHTRRFGGWGQGCVWTVSQGHWINQTAEKRIQNKIFPKIFQNCVNICLCWKCTSSLFYMYISKQCFQ